MNDDQHKILKIIIIERKNRNDLDLKQNNDAIKNVFLKESSKTCQRLCFKLKHFLYNFYSKKLSERTI